MQSALQFGYVNDVFQAIVAKSRYVFYFRPVSERLYRLLFSVEK
jgi:hypothetical protein